MKDKNQDLASEVLKKKPKGQETLRSKKELYTKDTDDKRNLPRGCRKWLPLLEV